MEQESEPALDPEAILLAILGLRDALERHRWAIGTALLDPNKEDLRQPGFPRWGYETYPERIRLAGITAVEFLNWTCALDELFAGPDRSDHRHTERQEDYRRRRDIDARGPILLGM